jgi:RNA polymerase sigma-70 factor (ECF subfamily)
MAREGPSVSDEELMVQLRDGSVAAFQILYERHHRTLFTFLLRFLVDRPTAEDLLQEAFLRVYLHRETYHPTAAFRTWLFTIARNLAVDHLRRQGITWKSPEPEELLTALHDPSPSPLQRVEIAESLEQIENALCKLSPGQREVLLLSRFVGLSHEEIAAVTGTSPGAVRVALHRALTQLKKLFGPL